MPLHRRPPLRLEIRLLGDLCVTRQWRTATAASLKAHSRPCSGYLACAGAAQLARPLGDPACWDGPDDPRAALRWSLTKLRPLLDDTAAGRSGWSRTGSGSPLPRKAPRWISHASMRPAWRRDRCRLARRAGRRRAPAARRVPRAVLDLARCYRFYHWCMAERERYDGLRRAVLCALVTRLEATPALALPSTDEPWWPPIRSPNSRMPRWSALLAAAGRYPDAEQHYAYARDMLRRELSTPPNGPLERGGSTARAGR
ncbi:hypothetical protein ACU4GD_06070 [Cupriavidus basilensis]